MSLLLLRFPFPSISPTFPSDSLRRPIVWDFCKPLLPACVRTQIHIFSLQPTFWRRFYPQFLLKHLHHSCENPWEISLVCWLWVASGNTLWHLCRPRVRNFLSFELTFQLRIIEGLTFPTNVKNYGSFYAQLTIFSFLFFLLEHTFTLCSMVSSSNFFQACSLSSERPFMHWAGYTWSFVFAVAAAPAANFLLTCHHFLAVKQPFSAAGHLRLVFDVMNILSWIHKRNKQRKERGRNRRNEWMDACCKCDIYYSGAN